ncbi:MAG TPA: NADH-quinone oxidoreductase subunit L [Verrucomicrobiae bacterium]|nr:NADH-quinone oxidoreductase subunit L [Verrucomicrobiae bacterium]
MLRYLWLIPVLPLIAAALTAVAKQPRRKFAATLAIGSMVLAFLLSCGAMLAALGQPSGAKAVFNFPWFQLGDGWVQLGWMLDPLTAIMLVMVSFVGLLIFIYSTGYMAHDENFTRFFCFLSLFASAMLGVIIANSLLLFFICWELVGLTSYLLIGFWYHKPSAAAAAKKAFVTTRIGDLAFLLGMVWLYSQTGTLLFYDAGHGCLEQEALTTLVTRATSWGIAASTGIGLLIFCGAIGKSGQVPLHVWLPDAMEGPTPVSALIHAATMVAAGVFLVARMYPLMAAQAPGAAPETAALQAVTWVGTITAVFAATIAVAQTDIKRILAYSTVSQLGFMMMGLGMGGIAVGMFHLITHAFFKALLFMGAGSVIHGCHEEQDIRYMGGVRKFMPVTFATYAIGMLSLSGFPLLFSGFWSKDEILHSARIWRVSHWPFYLGLLGALLTAFYMTRQVFYVFFGPYRGRLAEGHATHAGSHPEPKGITPQAPHESPRSMTVPLAILAVCSVLLGFIGTPAWPWFQEFLAGGAPKAEAAGQVGVLGMMLLSAAIVFIGIGVGYRLYGRKPPSSPEQQDVLETRWPNLFTLLKRKYYVDEAYDWAVVGLNAWWAKACDWMDRWVWSGAVQLISVAALGLAWVDRFFDELVINGGFDQICRRLKISGQTTSRLQNGQVQRYLRIIGIGMALLTLALIWGCRSS